MKEFKLKDTPFPKYPPGLEIFSNGLVSDKPGRNDHPQYEHGKGDKDPKTGSEEFLKQRSCIPQQRRNIQFKQNKNPREINWVEHSGDQ